MEGATASVVVCASVAPDGAALSSFSGCPVGTTAYLVDAYLPAPSSALLFPPDYSALASEAVVLFSVGAVLPLAFYVIGAKLGVLLGLLRRF